MQLKDLVLAYTGDWSRQVPPQSLVSLTFLHGAPSVVLTYWSSA